MRKTKSFTCEQCKKEFEFDPWQKRGKRIFCGRVCHAANNESHGLTGDSFYKRFSSMRSRCAPTKSSHPSWRHYGGRGIKCLWNSFEEFKVDMYDSFLVHKEEFGRRNTTLERIDNDGNYCKENCRWATYREQMNNMTRNVFLDFDGKSMTPAQWSRLKGWPRTILYNRMILGWSTERALTTPRGKNKRTTR